MALLKYPQYLLIGCWLVPVLSLLIIIYYVSRSYRYWSNRTVYQTRQPLLYFLGHFLGVLLGRKSVPSLCHELYTETPETSPLVGFYFLWQPALLVREHKLVRDVLDTRSNNFSLAFVEPCSQRDPLMACSPPFALTDDWMTRVFDNRPRLESTFDKLWMICHELKNFVINTLPPYQGTRQVLVDLDVIVDNYVRYIGMSIGLGMDLRRPDLGSTLVNHIDDCIADALKPSINQSLCLMTPGIAAVLRKRLVSTKDHDVLRNLVSRVLNGVYPTEKGNLLQWLAYLNVTRENQVLQLFAFFAETRIYLSGMARFALCQLAVNERVQRKARQELQQVLARNNDEWSMSLIQDDLPYLDHVISETLRLYPPVGCIARICTQRTRLEFEGRGCWLRPGDLVFVSVRGLHLDSKYWMHPKEFNPDRFEEHDHRRMYAPNEGLSPTNAQVCHLALKLFIVTMISVGRITEVVGGTVPEVDPRSYVTVPSRNASVLIEKEDRRSG